jgi:F-type H+-transporting ATPase subunit gamma
MRQIRSRIRVAKNIQQITKAMKMVAAARLKRAQDRVQAARPYARKMEEVVQSLASASAGTVEHPLLETRPVNKAGVLIITADRGLCGSYNSGVIRCALDLLAEIGQDRASLYIAGRKGNQFFRRRGWNVVESFQVDSKGTPMADATAITRRLRQDFEEGRVDEVYVVYTKFQSAITQRPTVLRLLPIEPKNHDPSGETSDFLFEPAAGVLLGELLPRYLLTQVFQALIESVASEHGSRMTSMSSATDNASTMISSLTLSLNRARQASITKELAEIVGGAEALKG